MHLKPHPQAADRVWSVKQEPANTWPDHPQRIELIRAPVLCRPVEQLALRPQPEADRQHGHERGRPEIIGRPVAPATQPFDAPAPETKEAPRSAATAPAGA